MSRYTLLLPLYACAVAATPLQSINVCAIESAVIDCLHQYTAATAFCSTFLNIETSTATVVPTVTPPAIILTNSATVTAPFVSVTSTTSASVTVTSAVVSLVTPTSTTTVTNTEISVLSCVSSATTLDAPALNKRDKKTSTLVTTPKSSSTSLKTSATIPAALQTWASSALSTACSCLSLPTPTVTVTSATTLAPATNLQTDLQTITPTTTIIATDISTVTDFTTTLSTADPTTVTVTTVTTSSSFQPTGLTYYYYPNQNAQYQTYGYSRVPSIVDSLSGNPNYQNSGSVQNINNNGFKTPDGNSITLPDGTSVAGADFALIFQGYLYASAGAGAYTISSGKWVLDDTGLVWSGNNAYGQNWNFGNQDYYDTNDYSASTTIQLAAGELYPITIFWANLDGPGGSDFEVTTPDGVKHVDTTGLFFGACNGALFEP